MMSKQAVFLDRDGVLNRAVVRDGRPYPPSSLTELDMLPDAADACRALRRAGYTLVMVTNQPDIRRGTASAESVGELNAAVADRTGIDHVVVCCHDDGDGCDCRKPKPGMILRAARQLGIDLERSYMVGDRWRDVEAGRAAGCRTVFIDRDYSERRPESPDLCAASLAQATRLILGRSSGASESPSTGLRIFADGADLTSMLMLKSDPRIQGFTTNPTLMRKAGVLDYEGFGREAAASLFPRPVSLEVLSDDPQQMAEQAKYISTWGSNVFVKVPVCNSAGESCLPVIEALAHAGVRLNVTAIMTLDQIRGSVAALAAAPAAFVSVFAGRIADTGRDPVPVMRCALRLLEPWPHLELLWASPREVLNVWQAAEIGCHVITVTPELLPRLALYGKDLEEYAAATAKMFADDARAAGYSLPAAARADLHNAAVTQTAAAGH